jgi:hypothetical protein
MPSEVGKDSVYSALRQEMTQTLFAFRQLLIGELAGYAALISGMLAVGGSKDVYPYTFPAIVCIESLIAFLILSTTLIGHTWCGVAFRLGSYILVAFEVPALVGKEAGSKDRAGCWILANRSEALCHKGKPGKGRVVIPGSYQSV